MRLRAGSVLNRGHGTRIDLENPAQGPARRGARVCGLRAGAACVAPRSRTKGRTMSNHAASQCRSRRARYLDPEEVKVVDGPLDRRQYGLEDPQERAMKSVW